uniref:Uncharacterized protein n=1 Tax=Sinocyclocheilus rhinocerous TaxID=307959 RepID=A0A673MA91_9TELE
ELRLNGISLTLVYFINGTKKSWDFMQTHDRFWFSIFSEGLDLSFFLTQILQGDCKPGRIRGFWGWNVSPRCNNRKFSPAPKVFVCTS